jgi:hypothetical protein
MVLARIPPIFFPSPYISLALHFSLATAFLWPLHFSGNYLSLVPTFLQSLPAQAECPPKGACSEPKSADTGLRGTRSGPSSAYPRPKGASQSSKRCLLVSIEHQLKPQTMPSRLGGVYSSPTE